MTQRPGRGLAGLAALLACAGQPPPPPTIVAAAPVPIELTPIAPLPMSNAPVMVYNRIVDPYTGETLAAVPATTRYDHAHPGEVDGQYWVDGVLYDIESRTALRTLSEAPPIDDSKSGVRRDADGKPLLSPTPRLRPAEHILARKPSPTGWYITTNTRILAFTLAGEQSWELRGFDDNFLGNTRLIALPGGDLLINNFSHLSDSGVTLIRVDARGNQRWRTYCQDAGLINLEYYHVAYVALRGEDLVVVSQGSHTAWIEILDARTGASKQRVDADEHDYP